MLTTEDDWWLTSWILGLEYHLAYLVKVDGGGKVLYQHLNKSDHHSGKHKIQDREYCLSSCCLSYSSHTANRCLPEAASEAALPLSQLMFRFGAISSAASPKERRVISCAWIKWSVLGKQIIFTQSSATLLLSTCFWLYIFIVFNNYERQ